MAKSACLRKNILTTKDLHRLDSGNPRGGAVSGIWISKTVRSEGNNVPHYVARFLGVKRMSVHEAVVRGRTLCFEHAVDGLER